MNVEDLPPLDCAGCRKCCIGDTVEIHPEDGDDHRRWKTDYHGPDRKRTLRKGKDGNCVYLGARGCTIHGKQPSACREYDCRALFIMVRDRLGLPGIQRRADRDDFQEGRRRVEALETSQNNA